MATQSTFGIENTVQRIAKKVLGIETLEERKHDSLDFHELSVWQIREALLEAYYAGIEDPGFSESFVQVVSHWIAGTLRFPKHDFDSLTIVAGLRRDRNGEGSWGGVYRHKGRTVKVLMPRTPVTYPQSLAHNRAEAGRQADDAVELFVWILAHELVHAMATFASETPEQLSALNYEPRVRNASWDVLLAFRHQRDTLRLGVDLALEGAVSQ
jgi:hypothetical protein